jgi:mRNA interferase MazF
VTDARRGEVWYVDFGEPMGHEQGFVRPALVVSSDEWNRHATILTVLALTRTKHRYPTRIEIEPDATNGLEDTSYARCEDIRSVSERRLMHRVGAVDAAVMSSVGRTLRIFLDV